VNHTEFGALPARWVGAAIGRIGPIYEPSATQDSSMQARRDRSRSPRFVASDPRSQRGEKCRTNSLEVARRTHWLRGRRTQLAM